VPRNDHIQPDRLEDRKCQAEPATSHGRRSYSQTVAPQAPSSATPGFPKRVKLQALDINRPMQLFASFRQVLWRGAAGRSDRFEDFA
jgi:hypothetical protein